MSKRSLGERFWCKVVVTPDPNGCWIWTGALSHGYGAFGIGGHQIYRAHRLSYEMANGVLLPGMQVDHICHNRACVNPAHLRAATPKQNQENRAGATRLSISQIRGVHRNPQSPNRPWKVRVSHKGRMYSGGTFADLVEAEAAAIGLRNRLYTHNVLDR